VAARGRRPRRDFHEAARCARARSKSEPPQFFHSLAFAAAVAVGWKALYDWQPETDDARFWRKVGMIGAGAYLCHLVLDATTKRSLPLIGR